MKHSSIYCISLLILTISFSSCSKKIKQQEDEIYSRHLQQHLKLTIISTPMPDDKSSMNLLLLNDGQDVANLNLKETLNDLYNKKLIQPLMIVAIHTTKREEQYGVAGFLDFKNRGNKADKYAEFIDNELYFDIKKKAGVRKFNSIAIAGMSLGGLSAFDFAWNHADKIDKVGVFSGSFWWRDKDTNDSAYSDATNRIMLRFIKSSRKKPHLKYWFYAGADEEKSDRDLDGITDVIDDTKDLIELIKSKNVCPPTDIIYEESATGKHDYAAWSKAFPSFLIWAFGK